MYASPTLRRRSIAAVSLVAVLVAAGCGGGSGDDASATQRVSGPGFTFAAPIDRELARTTRAVTVLPVDEKSPELVSVTRFPLAKVFEPRLWPKAVGELDGVAERLAAGLGGEYAEPPKTVRRSGVRGRRYEIAYERDGVELRQRLTLLLRERTDIEYQLLCRWAAAESEPEACALLEQTFAAS